MTTRIILVGGFLGAGKTTLLLRAAQMLTAQGYRVGMITNDQGQGLVDTALVHDHAIPVHEVAGGCFCCRFPDFLAAVRQLEATVQPDIILGEPVGSCTDLVATILLPLQAQFPDQFVLAPLTILIDPLRDTEVFPEAVAYLYDKQLSEADIIGVSKSDRLSADEVNDHVTQATRHYALAHVMPVSAQRGDGLQRWLDTVLAAKNPLQRTLDLNYERYAEAEAVLGWLNMQGRLTAAQPFSATDWITQALEYMDQELGHHRAAIAHLKIHLVAPDFSVKASLTAAGEPISWDRRAAQALTDRAEFTLNARVALSPETLEHVARQAVEQHVNSTSICCTDIALERFRPAAPRPTFRQSPASLSV